MDFARQVIHKLLGEGGCYLISLILWAELMTGLVLNDVEIYMKSVREGWMDRDGYLIHPEKIFGLMVGGTWSVRHETADYIAKPGEIEVERWGWKKTMAEFAHFKPPFADPYGESETVKNGSLVSKRILWRVA